ncbi:MAG: efflux RND transporter periplasmic adaptor subunit [Syntrophales bacterium]
MNATTVGYGSRETGTGRSLPALVLLVAAGVFLLGCGEKITPGTAPVKRQTIRGVSVATLAPTRVDEVTEAAGTVRAAKISYVASRMMGTVTSLLVKEGDAVEKGQLLLTIDDSDVIQKVKAAEAGHREAAKALEAAKQNRELTDITYGRYRKMFEEKAISAHEMDQFETQQKVAALEHERVQEMVNRASAALSEAKIYLGFTRVTAPVTGLVTGKTTEAGSMAVPGMPLLTVEDTAAFHAEVTVDESLSGKLKAGMPVLVSIEAINRRVTGKITEILPAVDSQSRSFTVKISVSGPGLRSGLYAKARIPRGKKEIILAPKAAIIEKGQLTGVYAVDSQGTITYRLVRAGREYDGNQEILSGLKAGDRIIVQGAEKAVDGGVMETGQQ